MNSHCRFRNPYPITRQVVVPLLMAALLGWSAPSHAGRALQLLTQEFCTPLSEAAALSCNWYWRNRLQNLQSPADAKKNCMRGCAPYEDNAKRQACRSGCLAQEAVDN